MAMVGFKNTHNQEVFINPAQVIYVTNFEDGISLVAFAVTGAGGKPVSMCVRGGAEQVRQRLEGLVRA